MKSLSVFSLAIMLTLSFTVFAGANTAGEGSYWVHQVEVTVLDEDGLPSGFITPGEPFQIQVSFDVPYALPMQDLGVLVVLQGEKGELYRLRDEIILKEGWGSISLPLLFGTNGSETLMVEAYVWTKTGYERLVDAVPVQVVPAPIVLPPDKVLRVSKTMMEFEYHGELEISPTAAVYQHWEGEQWAVPLQSVLVGFKEVMATMYGGQILRIDVFDPLFVQTMRVAITTDQFSSIEHETLAFSAVSRLYVEERRTGRGFVVDSKQQVTVSAQDGILIFTDPQGKAWEFTERVYIWSDPDGMIQIDSFQRGVGRRFYPKYRGHFEITLEGEDRFLVINEVSLEEYLYQVVPSEMPVSWPLEALKAQAVAARTYAVAQAIHSRQGSRGYHVDDSTSSQVYNNQLEAERAKQAIDATRGQILVKQDGTIGSTYFHSTSAGVSMDSAEVWYDRTIISYDKDSPWFRWQFSLSGAELTHMIQNTLPLQSVGEVEDLVIVTRDDAGRVTALDIVGTTGTVRIEGEFNIRSIIRPSRKYTGGSDVVLKRNGDSLFNQELLPSACFAVEMTRNEQGKITRITFLGGGSGHGLGMSQWGAKGMAEAAHDYKSILAVYYQDTHLITHSERLRY